METTLHVIGSTAVLAVWLAPMLILAFCATCEGCGRLLSRFHGRPHPRPAAPGVMSR